jgi:hypothetical protein
MEESMRLSFRAAFAAVVLTPFTPFAPLAHGQFVDGHLFVAGWKTKIWEVDPATWSVTLFADQTAGLNGVSSLQFFTGSTLLETNYYDNKILSFDSTGVATTLWSSTNGLRSPYGENGLAATFSGDLIVSNYGAKQVLLFPSGWTTPTLLADSSRGIVHADGLATDAFDQVWIVNRDGMNVLKIDRADQITVVDTLPDMPMSVAVRNNGDVYVGCFYGDVYRYPGGDPAKRSRLVTFNRTLGTPVLRFDLAFDVLYMTSSNVGNLLTVDPDTGKYTEVLPAGTFVTPVSMEVAGPRADIGIAMYGTGKPGTGGIVPTLSASGHPVFGQDLTAQLRGFLAGSTAIIAISGDSADDPFLGGTVLIGINGSTSFKQIQFPSGPLIGGFGSYDETQTVPAEPQLDGRVIFAQVFDFDPGAADGVSFSNGLQITIRTR